MKKCPFPGMDPFIEADDWQDFHLTLTAEIKRQLSPQLPGNDVDAVRPIGGRTVAVPAAAKPTRGYSAPDIGSTSATTITPASACSNRSPSPYTVPSRGYFPPASSRKRSSWRSTRLTIQYSGMPAAA